MLTNVELSSIERKREVTFSNVTGMVSFEHEYLLELVRSRPSLVTTLMAEVGVHVPAFDEATLGTCDLSDRRPTEYRADAVVILKAKGKPVRAVILEVQRKPDKRKKWSWPVYISTLRAIRKCPVVLLVFCEDRATAQDCALPIDMGHPGWILKPVVAGPSNIPKITDIDRALTDPELTALSTIVYGNPDTPDGMEVLRTFAHATARRPKDQPSYAELVFMLLPEFDFAQLFKEAGVVVSAKDVIDHPYVREWVELGKTMGKAEGEAVGKAEALLSVLHQRGIDLPHEAQQRIRSCTNQDTLDNWLNKALKIHNANELFD
ncbi:hypothetical protein ACFMQL_19000 [Nonomuraea fastidiosa]|uniref:hypothetical protein n=1 Tax=Nonomuraea TaxID=83681 RepID=UPI00324BF170